MPHPDGTPHNPFKDSLSHFMQKASRSYDCALKEIRFDKQISQQEIADAINVSRQTISAIETHRHEPTISLTLKLAEYLNMPVEEIFENHTSPHKK